MRYLLSTTCSFLDWQGGQDAPSLHPSLKSFNTFSSTERILCGARLAVSYQLAFSAEWPCLAINALSGLGWGQDATLKLMKATWVLEDSGFGKIVACNPPLPKDSL